MNEQNIYNEPATLTAELQDAAFEYLLLNPGSEFGDWSKGLIEEYPADIPDRSMVQFKIVNLDNGKVYVYEHQKGKGF